MPISDNLESVKLSLAESAKSAGRKIEDIELLAVSKTKPIELLWEAIEAGQKVLGENRMDEAVNKSNIIGDKAKIDFIGHIQSNKAKHSIGKFRLLHSVESLKLAHKLNRLNSEASIIQDILLEVNCSLEESKFGFKDSNDLWKCIDEILGMKYIRLRGLMTMAPFVNDKKIVRKAFADCRELFEEAKNRGVDDNWNILSMGMSSDYEEAIKEGSTMVRIGTAIFGGRS